MEGKHGERWVKERCIECVCYFLLKVGGLNKEGISEHFWTFTANRNLTQVQLNVYRFRGTRFDSTLCGAD
jgi:hypothetical protein